MLALSLTCAALTIALLVTVAWGLDAARAYRIAERRRIHAFRLAEVAGEREAHHKAISAEAIRQLRDAYERAPRHHTYTIQAHCRDLHDEN